MTTRDSTRKAGRGKANGKPDKPYDEFPLFPHATRRWAKKIRGRTCYFGPWDDPDGALEKYLDQKDDLHAGRTPRTASGGLTVRELVNRFLTSKQHQLDSRELAPRTFQDYYATCERVISTFGKNRFVDDLASDDFEHLRAGIAKTRGAVALGNEVQRVRGLFKYAYDAGLIDKPMRYGPSFKKPSRRVLRRERNDKGPRMFESHELRALIDAAGVQLKAMILLGINCGFGNADCGTLPIEAVDLKGRWIDYPRPKTGIQRRCPLWPKTATALRKAIKERPDPKDGADTGLVFITKYGDSWSKAAADSPITKEMRKLLDDVKVKPPGKRKKVAIYRPGLGFYALRHTFETIGGESRDQVAVDHVMGHARNDMASVYRERISDERLQAVTDHVHAWLFGKKK